MLTRVLALLIALSAVVLAGFGFAPAFASQFGEFSRASLAETSVAIVVGRVSGTRSFWAADRSAILTDADLIVEETWKGSLPDRIVVRTLGGKVGRIRLEVGGAAKFVAGERVVLFLDLRDGAYQPAGMGFGKLTIASLGMEEIVVGPLPPGEPGARHDLYSMSLEALREEVLGLLGGVLP